MTSSYRLDGDKMLKCDLILKNKSEWITYAKKILANTNSITDDIIEKVLTFNFEFGTKTNSQ